MSELGTTWDHRVTVVVTDRPADELESLTRDRHVWAIRTPGHEAVAERVWAAHPEATLDAGITLFDGGEATPEDEVISILGVVEEHHGEHSHDPPVSVIEIIGAAMTPAVRAELGAYGFSRWEASAGGFVAYRSGAWRPDGGSV